MKAEGRLPAAPDDVPTSAASIALLGDFERRNGWEWCVEQLILDSHAIARAAAPSWVHPRHSEIAQRRVVDHQPCRTKCDRCSRCLHSRAWYARGGRPFAAGEVVPQW